MDNHASLVFATLLFPLIAIVMGAFVVSLVIALLRKSKKESLHSKRFTLLFLKIFGIVVTVIIVITMAFVVIPTVLQDRAFREKQVACAKETGYDALKGDSFSVYDANAQIMYDKCLERP